MSETQAHGALYLHRHPSNAEMLSEAEQQVGVPEFSLAGRQYAILGLDDQDRE